MELKPLTDNSSHNDFDVSSSKLVESPYASTTSQTRKTKSRIKESFRTRQSSVYIKRSRFSRYKNAMSTALPMRLTSAGNEQIPIDTVGCFSNASFFWSRKFIKNAADIEEGECKPSQASSYDGAEINAKRLLGKFKDNLQKHGTVKCSMFKVVYQFCSTRIIIAILIHTLAVLLEILGPTLFLKWVLDSVDTSNVEFLLIYGIAGFVLSMPLSILFKNMGSSINLRTANRLRTGILGAIFKKTIKSKISKNIMVHQLMSFTTEDSHHIYKAIESATLLIGLFIGFICISVASIFLLGFRGMWPLFVIFPLFIILQCIAKITTRYNQQSEISNSKKLTIVEELCTNFRNTVMLGFQKMLKMDFEVALHSQYTSLIWKEIFSLKLFGHVTSSMLMAGLYWNWWDFAIKTHLIRVLVLIILFSCLAKVYLVQIADGIQSLVEAIACLEKVKDAFTLEIAEQSMSKPKKEYFVTIENALFSWPHNNEDILINTSDFHLRVEQFYVFRGHIVGITGVNSSGKTTFAYSILGHTVHKHGDVRLKDRVEFYPTELFILDGTVKENILMGADFDSQKFYSAIVDTKLDKDVLTAPGFENIHIMAMDLKPHQLQRIVLARALYSEAGAFIFDEPFKNVWKSTEMCDLVKTVLFKLQIQDKTVILISNTAEFLSVCQHIHFIQNGQVISDTGTRGTYESFIEMPEYQEILITQRTLETANGYHEAFDGANGDGLALKKQKQSSSFSHSEENISEEKHLKHFCYTLTPVSNCSLIVIISLIILSNFGYFILPFGFIIWRNYLDPWLGYICIGIILALILSEIFIKCFYANSCEMKACMQESLSFNRLLRTSIDFLQTTHLSDITSMFMMTNFLQNASDFIHGINGLIGMLFSVLILLLANYWTVLVAVVQLNLTFLLFFKFRKSIKYFVKCEMVSRQKIFKTGLNLVKGRAVIMSENRENLNSLLKSLYNFIEDNSTSIFLQKSLIHYAQFLNQIFLWLSFVSTLIITVFMSPSKDSILKTALAIFGQYTFSYFNERFLNSFLNFQEYYEKCNRIYENYLRIQTSTVKSPMKPIIELYRGMPLEMVNIRFSLAIRELIHLQQLQAESGEKIGIVGDGANIVTSLLSKIIKPTRGEVMLNSISLEHYSNSSILFGFIPFDPKIDRITIHMLLDPDGAYQRKNHVQEALRAAKMWEYVLKLPRVLEEPINNLPRERRQQLCLAKGFIMKTIVEKLILVIEYPHLDLIQILEQCVNTEFTDNTVIIIAGIDRQLKLCDTVFEAENLLTENDFTKD